MEEQQSVEEKVPLLWAAGEVGKSLSSYFCLFFFRPCCVAYGILVSQTGIEHGPLAVKA